MNLRHNFSHVDLAFRFQISEATVANIVTTFTHVLYEHYIKIWWLLYLQKKKTNHVSQAVAVHLRTVKLLFTVQYFLYGS